MLVTVATYNQIYLADLDKARLLDYDVPCVIQDQNMVGMNLFYSTALGGIKLQVPEAYAGVARKILYETRGKQVEDSEMIRPACPRCKSGDVVPKRYNSILLMLSSILLLFPFGDTLFSTSESKYYCNTCGNKWEMIENDDDDDDDDV